MLTPSDVLAEITRPDRDDTGDVGSVSLTIRISPIGMMKATWHTSRIVRRLGSASVPRDPVRYASTIPPRSTGFTVPTKTHVDDLRSLLASPSSVLSTLDDSASKGDLVGYNDDWMNKYHGKSPLVVKPRDTEEVGKVVKYCYENDIAIVPQAGNTGLVGKYQD